MCGRSIRARKKRGERINIISCSIVESIACNDVTEPMIYRGPISTNDLAKI